MWGILLRIATVALAGAGLSEFVENIFGKQQTPVQAITGINYTKVLIGAFVTVAAFFIARNVLKMTFDK